MKATSNQISLALLMPLLSAAMAVVPVTPELHQAFADHDHFLCAEHHRIEDGGFKQARASWVQPASDESTSFVSPLTGKRPLNDTPPCGLSNLHIQSHRPAGASFWFSLVRAPSGTVQTSGIEIPPRDLLTVAPKHSPPATFSN